MAIATELIKKKVAIYIRVSTHWQVDKDSLQVQRRELIAYCEMLLGIQDYEVFEDPGYSGKNVERPAYKSMMRRVRSGEFSHILVWKIDRISRNLLDFASMYEELKDRGVTFVSKNEQFDSSTAMGEAMLKIILVFAELERNITAERVTSVMLSRAENGQWNGGRVPFGYNYDKQTKEFSVNEDEAAIVRKIYDLYLSEQSTLQVCRILKQNNLKTRSGANWSVTQIHKILTNKFYIGSYVYNVHKESGKYAKNEESEWITIDNHHIPIISSKQFERAALMLSRRKRGGVQAGMAYTRKNVHVFAGLMRCSKCGSNVSSNSGRPRKDGWRPSTYCCGKARRHMSCDNKAISDSVLGPFTFNYIANVLRAKQTITENTSVEALERKLLRGDAFSDVASIERSGLNDMLEMFAAESSGSEYVHTSKKHEISIEIDEIRNLEDQVRKSETALNRLKSLYMYAPEAMPEKEFVIERKRLVDDIDNANARIAELRSDPVVSSTADSDFMERASYFVMTQKLLEDRNINFEKYIRTMEPVVPRNFIRSVISEIGVDDGRVASITFKNGITHIFNYRNSGK